jgi:hypothetical protein
MKTNYLRELSTMTDLYNEIILYTPSKTYMGARKTIAISVENYDKLKKYGFAGESMNRAISKLLAIAAGGSD